MQINSDILRLMSANASLYSPAIVSSGADQLTQNAIQTINYSNLLGFDRELRFSKDSRSNLSVVDVVDRASGQVVVQIPSQIVLDLADSLQASTK